MANNKRPHILYIIYDLYAVQSVPHYHGPKNNWDGQNELSWKGKLKKGSFCTTGFTDVKYVWN